jgi:hypothetical protein
MRTLSNARFFCIQNHFLFKIQTMAKADSAYAVWYLRRNFKGNLIENQSLPIA